LRGHFGEGKKCTFNKINELSFKSDRLLEKERPVEQRIGFLAKRLLVDKWEDKSVILATPLFVYLAE
jgi:hypothetical protein